MSNFTSNIEPSSVNSSLSLVKKKELIASVLEQLQEPSRIEEAGLVQKQMSNWEIHQAQYLTHVKRNAELKARAEKARNDYNYMCSIAELEEMRTRQQVLRQNIDPIFTMLRRNIQQINELIRPLTRAQLAQLKSYRRPPKVIEKVFTVLAIVVKYQFLKPLERISEFPYKMINQLPQFLCKFDLFKLNQRDMNQVTINLAEMFRFQWPLIDPIIRIIFTWLVCQVNMHPQCLYIKSLQFQIEDLNFMIEHNTKQLNSALSVMNQVIENYGMSLYELQYYERILIQKQLDMENTFKQSKVHKYEAFLVGALQQIQENSNYPPQFSQTQNSIKNIIAQCQIQLLQLRDLKPIDELFDLEKISQSVDLLSELEYFEIINQKFDKFISSKRIQHYDSLNSLKYFQLKFETLLQIQSLCKTISEFQDEKFKIIQQLNALNIDLQESKVEQNNLLIVIDKHPRFKLTMNDFLIFKILKNPSKADYLITKCISKLIIGRYHSYSEFNSQIRQFYGKFRSTRLLDYNFEDSEAYLIEILKLEVQSNASKKIFGWIKYAFSVKQEIDSYHKRQLQYQALKIQQEQAQSKLEKLENSLQHHEEQWITLINTFSQQNQCICQYLQDIPQIRYTLQEFQFRINDESANIDSYCLIIDFVKQERFIFKNSQIDLDEFLTTIDLDYFTDDTIQVICKHLLNSTTHTKRLIPTLKELTSQSQKSDVQSAHAFFEGDKIQFQPIQNLIKTIIPQQTF